MDVLACQPDHRIMVLEDDFVDRMMIERFIDSRYSIHSTLELQELRTELEAETIDCVLLDYHIPRLDAKDVLDLCAVKGVPVIVLSGSGNEEIVAESFRCGASEYLPKDGLTKERLLNVIDSTICRALMQRSKETALKTLMETCNEIKVSEEAVVRLIAHIGHEIRNPIGGILGLAELCLEHSLSKITRENIEAIKQSSESLMVLLEGILDASKARAGKFELSEEEFSLRAMVKDIQMLMEFTLRSKNLVFNAHFQEDLPSDRVFGDYVRLRQILLNLVGNAIKFTPDHGVVLIFVEEVGPSEREGYRCYRLSVANTGHGIAAGEIPKLFEAFHQTEDGSKVKGGAGLGLNIVKELAELLQGDVTVESREEQGTVFHSYIPLKPVHDQDRDSELPN